MTARAQAQVHEINSKINESTPNKAENGAAAAPATPDLKNAEKKDLLELLQKMNKKVKALTVIRQQLTTKVEQTEHEKNSLLNLVAEEILNGAQVSGDDVVPQLRKAWQEQDEQNNLTLQQLQKEFQKIQHPAPNGDWENEKKQLVAKHEEELAKVKADALQSNGNSGNQDEIQRIKEAAAAQLQAFKKKVATARSAEITKVKTETAASAKKIMETKLLEQKQKFEVELKAVKEQHSGEVSNDGAKEEEIENLRQQLQAAREMESKSLQQQQTQFEQQLESLKQQLAAAQTGSSAAVASKDSEIDDLRQEVELVKATESKKLLDQKEEFERQLNSMNQQLASHDATNEVLSTKEAELGGLKLEIERTKEHATTKLEEQQREFDQQIKALQEQVQAQATLQSALAAKETEIEQQKKDFEAQRLAEVRSLQEGFATEKEELLLDYQQRLNTAATNSNKSLEEQKSIAIQEVTAQFEEKMRKLSTDLVQSRAEAVKIAVELSEQANREEIERYKTKYAAELAKVQDSLMSQVGALEKQLQESETGRKATQDREESLQGELDEVKSLLSSAREGQESSAHAVDEALATQRASYEERLATKDRENQSISETLTQKIAAAEKDRDDVRSSLKAEVENLQRTMDAANKEIDTLKGNLSTGDESRKVFQAELESKIEQLSNQLSEKEKEILSVTESRSDVEAKLAETSTQYTELESKLMAVQEQAEAQGDKNSATESALKSMEEQHKKALDELRVSLAKQYQQELQKQLSQFSEKATADTDSKIQEVKSSYELKLDEAQKASQASMSESKAQYEEAQKSADDLQSKLLTLEEENLNLQKSLSESKTLLDSAASSKSAANEAALEQLEAKCADAEKTCDAMRAELDDAKEKAKNAEDRLKSALASSTEEIKQAFTSQISRLEEEKSELSKQLVASSESFEQEKKKMRDTMEKHVDKMTAQFREKLEGVRKTNAEEIAAAKKANQERDEKMVKLVDRLKALTATSTKLRDENEGLKKKLAAEANTQKSLKDQLASAQKQMDETLSNSSETAASLLKQQEDLEKQKLALEEKSKQQQTALQIKSNKVEELTGKLQALSGNLNALTEDHRLKDEKLEHASKIEAKLTSSESEVSELREQVNKLKLERTKADTMIEKLQAEKETNERNKGQRTALVGMLETQLSEMNDKLSETNAKLEAANYDLSQKEDDLKLKGDEISSLKSSLDESQSAAKRTAESLAAAQKGADNKSSKMVEALQKELQATKQQMARKSTAAQKLLQQREAECSELRKTNKALQTEVDKGSYSDRKIFELAEQQCNRESAQASEIEMREAVIDRMRQALLERDGDLAYAEKKAHEVELQLEELFRIRRRDDVNIDYLKGIVVKYLSLPPGSSERAGLLPVLATLLQFDQVDYKTIEEGKNKVSWWGSSVVPTLINGPSSTVQPAPATTGSAEVSVSSGPAPDSSRRTSLQF